MHENALNILGQDVHGFDARGIAKRFRHAAIFGALSALHPGATMRFTDDHHPLPLLNHNAAHAGAQVALSSLTRSPGAVFVDCPVR